MVKDKKRKGTVLEREFKAYFTKFGYLVTRAAGSFGIDLIALKKYTPPLLINVKWRREYCGPKERQDLIDNAQNINGMALLVFKHYPKNRKNGIHCINILNPPDTLYGDTAWKLLLPNINKCNGNELNHMFGCWPIG